MRAVLGRYALLEPDEDLFKKHSICDRDGAFFGAVPAVINGALISRWLSFMREPLAFLTFHGIAFILKAYF